MTPHKAAGWRIDPPVSLPTDSGAIEAELPVIENQELTPSARVLQEMRERKQTFFHFAMDMCEQHQQYYRQSDMPTERMNFFEKEARESKQRQHEIEANDRISFEQYLEQYFAQS